MLLLHQVSTDGDWWYSLVGSETEVCVGAGPYTGVFSGPSDSHIF